MGNCTSRQISKFLKIELIRAILVDSSPSIPTLWAELVPLTASLRLPLHPCHIFQSHLVILLLMKSSRLMSVSAHFELLISPLRDPLRRTLIVACRLQKFSHLNERTINDPSYQQYCAKERQIK